MGDRAGQWVWCFDVRFDISVLDAQEAEFCISSGLFCYYRRSSRFP